MPALSSYTDCLTNAGAVRFSCGIGIPQGKKCPCLAGERYFDSFSLEKAVSLSVTPAQSPGKCMVVCARFSKHSCA